MNIFIVDDEFEYLKYYESKIANILKDISIQSSIYTFETVDEFLNSDWETADLIFLDIELKDEDGIELGKKIRRKSMETEIVYISAYAKYSMQLHEIRILNFIIKGEDEDRKIKNAISFVNLKLNDMYIKLECNGHEINLNKVYIIAVESHLRKKKIYYFNDILKQVEIYEFYLNFEELISTLNSDFIQIHRGIIVNKNYIREKRIDSVKLITGEEFPVGKSFRNNVGSI